MKYMLIFFLFALCLFPTRTQAAKYELTDALIQFLAQVDVATNMHTPQHCTAKDMLSGPYSFPNEDLLMNGWRMACTTTLTCVAERLETKGL